MASAAAQAEEVAEQDAAVAAEDHGEEAVVQNGADGVGQGDGIPRDAERVEDPCGLVPPRVIRWSLDPAGPYGPEPLGQTGIEEGRRHVLDAGGP